MTYIWQTHDWPHLTWHSKPLLPLISKARLAQGKLLTKVTSLGLQLHREASADILTEEAVQTSAIEGEHLNRASVRSSVAQHLGLPTAGLSVPDRSVDGLVEVLSDATEQHNTPLTAARLKRWQAALFPTGQSGLRRIRTGQWRGPGHPIQVVSGLVGRETIHYEAPPGKRVQQEMRQFLAWWKTSRDREEGLVRSGVAHFYFVTIHPFDDGNGRIARALTDMALAQDEQLSMRAYSLSSQIVEDRDGYYQVLERSQTEGVDITEWLIWYLGCYERAIHRAEQLIAAVFAKATFWQRHDHAELNTRQRKVVQRLLDAGKEGFMGGLTTRKYVSLAKVSRATASREIAQLVDIGILRQNPAKGRSASYDLQWV